MIHTFYDSLIDKIKIHQSSAENDNHKEYLDGVSFAMCANALKEVVVFSQDSEERSEGIEVIKKVINDFKLPLQDLDSIYNKIHTKNPYEGTVSRKALVNAAYSLSEALVECVMCCDINHFHLRDESLSIATRSRESS